MDLFSKFIELQRADAEHAWEFFIVTPSFTSGLHSKYFRQITLPG